MSDHGGQRPTMTDNDRQRPTLSDRRSEHHTVTSREVMKLFELANLPRSQRSIERYCKEGKLDCFVDPDEQRYYVTQASVDLLIGQLKEIQARHHQEIIVEPFRTGPTSTDDVRQRATSPEIPHKETGTYEVRIKELEDKVFHLSVEKEAKDQVVTMLRDQIKEDRAQYTTLIQESTEKLAKYSRQVGQLETRLLQLEGPKHDAVRDASTPVEIHNTEIVAP
jgi:hypothetical protein